MPKYKYYNGTNWIELVPANSAITGATKCKITYDEKGLVTGGADLSASDIPDLSSTYLPKTGGTVSGTLILSKQQDLSGTANNKPALIVGGTDTQPHIEIDANEIQAKNNGTTTAVLYLNYDGGNVQFGNTGNAYASGGYLYSGGVKVTTTTVNNGTLTLQVAGTTKTTFTANQSGAATFNVTAADLGLSSAMKFVGVSTTDPAASGATISGISSYEKGNVVIYKRSGETHYEEYINTDGNNNASSWELLGDADSYALNSITVSGDGALTGGGTLTQNRTITHQQLNTSGAKSTAAIYKTTLDAYGHVLSAVAATASDIPDLSDLYVTLTTDQAISGEKTFNSNVRFGDGGFLLIEDEDSNYTVTLRQINNGGVSANRTAYLPNKSGTLAMTSDLDNYLPLTAGNDNELTGDLYLSGNRSIKSDGDLTLETTTGGDWVGIKSSSTYKANLLTDALTADRNFTFPDKSGTFALEGESKTFTGLIGTANEYKDASFYLFNVKPDSWGAKEWSVRYRYEVTLDNGLTPSGYLNTGSIHECYISGARGLYRTYAMFNSINNTDYRLVYYNLIQETTEAGFNAGYPHKIGVELTSSWARSSPGYERTIKVTILECKNCTVSFVNAPEIPAQSTRNDYTKLNSTYYPNGVDTNSPGYAARQNMCDQGLQETGDNNTVNKLEMTYSYAINGTSNNGTALRILSYTLLGYDIDGKAMAFSVYSSSQTSRNANISTDRVYCDKGFDWTKGIVYQNASTVVSPGATFDNSFTVGQGNIDFRYTDNCINNANATTLGMVPREPVYLRGTIGADGLFYLDPITVTYSNTNYKRAWVQPSDATRLGTSPFDTNHVYWFIGYPYYNASYANSQYQIDLFTENALMYYDGTKLKPYGAVQVYRYI